MKKYQLLTYCDDCGEDECLEYRTIKEALFAARQWLRNTPTGGAIIYNLREWRICRTLGYFPEYARPIERKSAAL